MLNDLVSNSIYHHLTSDNIFSVMHETHVRRHVRSSLEKLIDEPQISATLSKDTHSFAGLGSSLNGQSLSQLICANLGDFGQPKTSQCHNTASLTCANCRLVRYCSKACQTHHWKKHRLDCKSPYRNESWAPTWLTEKRDPTYLRKAGDPLKVSFSGAYSAYLWGNVSAIDSLNLSRNEKEQAPAQDFNLCFTASGDIRNLISTVNGLPDNYRGKCQILFNDMNPVVVGHNLVILFALLSPGTSADEAAELAVHLMYSSLLTAPMSVFVYRCIDIIYGTPVADFLSTNAFATRGEGALHSHLLTEDVRNVVLDMYLSTYSHDTSQKSMRDIMLNPSRLDYRERFMAALEPGHRLAFLRYRESGVLAPFSFDLEHFNQPNRLIFSPQGEWLTKDNANPLFGWDVTAVRASGKAHGVDPADIYGCLFFHVKSELKKFINRVQNFNINIFATQFDASVLSGLIGEGTMRPYFGLSCFDRIETSNLADYIGISKVIHDWGPLLNKRNAHATLLTYFMNWTEHVPNATHDDANTIPLVAQCASLLGLSMSQVRGSYSTLRLLMGSLDLVYDNSKPFEAYLKKMKAIQAATAQGLRMRANHTIHPKRFGLSLSTPEQKMPKVSRDEAYDTFGLGGAEATLRFVEFECA